jgi:hypothetical protein
LNGANAEPNPSGATQKNQAFQDRIMNNATLGQNANQASTKDAWSVTQAEQNGKPLLIRYRSERPQGVEPAAFPFLLSATWTYQANEFGLPSAEEMELMDQFEDALASALEGSQTAHLMVVLTTNGDRDWLWYATGEEAAMSRVNQALRGRPRYPAQFSVQRDRGWRAYTQFQTGNGSPSSAGGPLGIIGWAIAKIMTAFCR